MLHPSFATNDLKMFREYISKSKLYFEWGSGGSTVEASNQSSIQKIDSIESDGFWVSQVREQTDPNRVSIHHADMGTIPNKLGYPSPSASRAQLIAYSNKILDLSHQPDTVLIDGRFRVACCLKSFSVLSENGVILFDDFLNRPFYHVVLKYFRIVDMTLDKRMVVLKKKVIHPPSKGLIQKYELDPR